MIQIARQLQVLTDLCANVQMKISALKGIVEIQSDIIRKMENAINELEVKVNALEERSGVDGGIWPTSLVSFQDLIDLKVIKRVEK